MTCCEANFRESSTLKGGNFSLRKGQGHIKLYDRHQMGSSYQKYAAMHINFRNQISRTEHARREGKNRREENVDIEKRPVKRVEVVAQRQRRWRPSVCRRPAWGRVGRFLTG
jgi:hypothetical protein